MRWQEEVTLTTYEMQWTVRYFAYKSKYWAKMQEKTSESCSRNADVGAGAVAYAKRKEATWEQLLLKSDRTFTIINSAYKSPL